MVRDRYVHKWLWYETECDINPKRENNKDKLWCGDDRCLMEEVVGVPDSEESVRFWQAEVWRKDNLRKWYEINKHGARAIHATESIHIAASKILTT